MLPWHPPDVWWLVADPQLNLAAVTMPGHEPDAGRVVRAMEREMEKAISTNFSDVLRPVALRSVLETYRRRGVPAVRAELDDEGRCITVHIARPAGFG
jgi:hypothetical protein